MRSKLADRFGLLSLLTRTRGHFAAYRKTAESEEKLKSLERIEAEDEFARIRCPWCEWRPQSTSRWFCADCDAPEYFYAGCGTMWNTFETRGRCPGCAHQWRWTSCLRCQRWSPHDEWYEDGKD
jgi:hypothetical protein